MVYGNIVSYLSGEFHLTLTSISYFIEQCFVYVVLYYTGHSYLQNNHLQIRRRPYLNIRDYINNQNVHNKMGFIKHEV